MGSLSTGINLLNHPIAIVGAGIIQFLSSIALIVFARPIGVGFCRLGKAMMNLERDKRLHSIATQVYDEEKAPTIVWWFGVFSLSCSIIITPIRLLFAQ